MDYSPASHAELTPQHYEILIRTGYTFMQFLGYLQTGDAVGIMLALYRPMRLKTDGQPDLVPIEDPLISNLVHKNSSIAIFIEKDY